MSVMEKRAHLQGRNDELPNQELAKQLASTEDRRGIKEIAENLWSKDKNIQSDCIKVLYEIGYIEPELIGAYVPDFIKLLSSGNNRLVWGAMTALSTVAETNSQEIFENRDKIIRAIESGSVITVDNGIRVLAGVAVANQVYSKKIFPYLIEHLRRCRPKEVAQHAESILRAVNDKNKKQYMDVLKERQKLLSPAQSARIRKIFKALESNKLASRVTIEFQ